MVATASLTVIVIHAVRSNGSPVTTAVSPSRPELTWSAGARRAPTFQLTDAKGRAVSLASLRGRVVLLTFIDPLCRNFCPLEAKVLEAADRSFTGAARPAIVSVSVNPYGDGAVNLSDDAVHWQLGPEWRWALGDAQALAQVWRAYAIGVRIDSKTIAGVTVHNVTHTEATYVIDAHGFERALFLYPFQPDDVAQTVRDLEASGATA